MVAPSFSIRTILIIVTAFAFYFLFAGLGVRGHAWAGGIAIGVGSFAVVAVIYAVLFWLCWIVAGKERKPTPVYNPNASRPASDSVKSSGASNALPSVPNVTPPPLEGGKS